MVCEPGLGPLTSTSLDSSLRHQIHAADDQSDVETAAAQANAVAKEGGRGNRARRSAPQAHRPMEESVSREGTGKRGRNSREVPGNRAVVWNQDGYSSLLGPWMGFSGCCHGSRPRSRGGWCAVSLRDDSEPRELSIHGRQLLYPLGPRWFETVLPQRERSGGGRQGPPQGPGPCSFTTCPPGSSMPALPHSQIGGQPPPVVTVPHLALSFSFLGTLLLRPSGTAPGQPGGPSCCPLSITTPPLPLVLGLASWCQVCLHGQLQSSTRVVRTRGCQFLKP